MSVSNETASVIYVGNGVADTFSWSFYIQTITDLEVVLAEFELDENNERVWSESVLNYPNHFTYQRNSVNGYGSLTLISGPLAQDFRLSLRRKMPIRQLVDIKNASTFNAETHETIMDRAAYVSQQIQTETSRAIKLHITDADGSFDTTLPPGAENHPTATIMINEDGDGFEWGPDASAIAGVADAASRSETAAAAAAISEAAAAANAAISSAAAVAAADAAGDVEDVKKRVALYAKGPYTSNTNLEAVGQIAYCDTSLGGFTVTLPNAGVMTDVKVIVKKISSDANVLTIAGTIDEETNTTIEYGYGEVTVISDGTEYWIV